MCVCDRQTNAILPVLDENKDSLTNVRETRVLRCYPKNFAHKIPSPPLHIDSLFVSELYTRSLLSILCVHLLRHYVT